MSYKLVEDLQKQGYHRQPGLRRSTSQPFRLLRSPGSAQATLELTSSVRPSVYLKAAFAASHKAYGSRRLTTAMAKRGQPMGRNRARTLMRLNGLRSVWRRKFAHTTDSKHAVAVSANVLSRQCEQVLPNQVWVCDITSIRTRRGWLYLAAVLDLHSRKIVGWAMSRSLSDLRLREYGGSA